MANPMAMFAGEKPGTRGADAVEKFKSPATAKLSLEDNFPLREFRFLRTTTDKPVKAILMGPDRVSQMCDTSKSIEQYRDTDRFLADVVHIQKCMVSELIEAGCTVRATRRTKLYGLRRPGDSGSHCSERGGSNEKPCPCCRCIKRSHRG